MLIPLHRKPVRFYPNQKRVIARFHKTNGSRTRNIIDSVLQMNDDEVKTQLNKTLRDFSKRHRSITKILHDHYKKVHTHVHHSRYFTQNIISEKKMLIGAFFTMEYAIESAAFFNPSMVEHPDQTELNPGEKRVIVSFRATGEGHISSIVFRMGIINSRGALDFELPGDRLEEPIIVKRNSYNKKIFSQKLQEMDISLNPELNILSKLDE